MKCEWTIDKQKSPYCSRTDQAIAAQTNEPRGTHDTIRCLASYNLWDFAHRNV